MAFISDDDGNTWQGGLMIDDAITSPTPTACKHQTGPSTSSTTTTTPDGEVLFANFTEADVRAGKSVSDKVRLDPYPPPAANQSTDEPTEQSRNS